MPAHLADTFRPTAAPPRLRPPGRAAAVVAVVVAAALAVRVPLLATGQIDYDEGVYWASLQSMASGHPLFSSVYSSQPPGFLLSVAPFYALGHTLAAARVAMLAFFLLGLVATGALARSLLGAAPAAVAVALLAADPLMLRQSVALQADGPATALGVGALALAAGAAGRRGGPGLAWTAAAGAVSALAVLVKPLAVVMAVPVMAVIALPPAGPRPRPARLAARAGALLLGGAVAAAALLAPFADRLGLVWSQAAGGHLSARGLPEGGLTRDMALTLARQSPFFLAALLGLALLARRVPRAAVVLAAWAAAAAALASLQRPLWPHHLVVASPLAAVAAAGLAQVRWAGLRQRARRVLGVAALAGLATAGLLTGVRALDHPPTADTVAASVSLLRDLTAPGELVLTDDQFAVAAAGRGIPPELVDTSYVRLDSQAVTAAAVEEIASRDGVRAVYLGTGRLRHLGALLAWVGQHYPRVTEVPGGATIYTAP